MNIKADIRVRVDLWIDCCKKCATKNQTKAVKQLREKIDRDMRIAATAVLRKQNIQNREIEVKFL